jgi:hypothetical protein
VYTIINQSLSRLLSGEKNKVAYGKLADLNTYGEDDLIAVCRILRVEPVYKYSKKDAEGTIPGRIIGVRTRETIDRIISVYTFDMYLPEEYWKKEHREKAREYSVIEQNKNAGTGRETFELFAKAGLGFANLRPEDKVEVDFPEEFVDEFLALHPMTDHLDIIDNKGQKITRKVTRTTEVDDKGKKKETIVVEVEKKGLSEIKEQKK